MKKTTCSLLFATLICALCTTSCNEETCKVDAQEMALLEPGFASYRHTIDGDLNAGVKIKSLPANEDGSNPWPDGIVAFDIGVKHYFALAAEANDSIIIVDDEGKIISNTRIKEQDVPSDYPCLEDEGFAGVKYSPDSITAFSIGTHTYVAVTLRYAGAVIFYDVTDPKTPVKELITRAGENDTIGTGTCMDEDHTSKVFPEGITSGKIGESAYIWVANEGDSSVTMLKLEDISSEATGIEAGTALKITQRITQQFSGNMESVRFVADREKPSAIAVSSKSRTIRYLEIDENSMKNYAPDYVGSYKQADFEFTNSAVVDATHSLVTLTKPIQNSCGKYVACGGELILVETGNTESVNAIVVGPMPDAVAVTPDKKYAITADEQDSTDAWGKCPVSQGKPGLSILQLTDDSGNLLEFPERLVQIQFGRNQNSEPREPEFIAIASDGDTVAVTLQDSHEVAIFKISRLLEDL